MIALPLTDWPRRVALKLVYTDNQLSFMKLHTQSILSNSAIFKIAIVISMTVTQALASQSQQDLNSLLISAQPGDVIETDAADFEQINLTGYSFSPAVTIKFHDDAKVTSMVIRNSIGLHFDNANIRPGVSSRPNSDKAVYVFGGGDLKFSNSTIAWDDDGDPTNNAVAMLFDGVNGLVVESNRISHSTNGTQVRTSSDVRIQNNQYSRMLADGIVASGITNLEILDNLCVDWDKIPGSRGHPDCIQLQTGFRALPVVNARIADNIIVQGKGDRFQGIFVASSHAGVPHINTTIENNVIRLDIGLGIAAGNVDGLTIHANDIRPSYQASDRPRIVLYDPTTNVEITDNVTSGIRAPDDAIVEGNELLP